MAERKVRPRACSTATRVHANGVADRSKAGIARLPNAVGENHAGVFASGVRESHAPARSRTRRRAHIHDGARAPRPDAAPDKSRYTGATPLSKPRVRRAVAIALGLAGIGLLAFISGARFQRQDIGHVGVVRNGGPLDGRSIRQILMPGSGVTWAGWYSQDPHEYPARGVVLLYTVTSDATRGDRPGVDVVNVPTRDGVRVGIEGTLYYHFSGE